jgi:hypothetical protein
MSPIGIYSRGACSSALQRLSARTAIKGRLSWTRCLTPGHSLVSFQFIRMQSLYAHVLSSSGGAAADIRSHPSGPEYSSYFGGDNDDTIWYNMDRIAGDLSDRSGDRTISCSQDGDPANLCGANSGKLLSSCLFMYAVFLTFFICQVSSPILTSLPKMAKSFKATSVNIVVLCFSLMC